MLRFSLLLAFLAVIVQADTPPSGNAVIRGKTGKTEIVITTTSRLAGAIHSLTWNGKEFIDSADHGRQLQSASNLDCGKRLLAETYNPTEAGSRRDGAGPRSSSKLLKLTAKGDELTTLTKMAFWLRPGEKSSGNPAYNTTILSNHLLAKRVKIGIPDMPHVIDYQVTFTVPEGETHTHAVFEALTGYMPKEFAVFEGYDAKQGKLVPLTEQQGEQRLPVVFSTKDGNYAMGIFSPDQPSRGFEHVGYGRFRFPAEKVVKWNCVFRVTDRKELKAGDYRYQMYVIVGTRETCEKTMAKLIRRK